MVDGDAGWLIWETISTGSWAGKRSFFRGKGAELVWIFSDPWPQDSGVVLQLYWSDWFAEKCFQANMPRLAVPFLRSNVNRCFYHFLPIMNWFMYLISHGCPYSWLMMVSPYCWRVAPPWFAHHFELSLRAMVDTCPSQMSIFRERLRKDWSCWARSHGWSSGSRGLSTFWSIFVCVLYGF